MTDDATHELSRPQRRLLRRIFNGRTVPLVVDGQPFLTYKEANRHLSALEPDERDAAYASLKGQALASSHGGDVPAGADPVLLHEDVTQPV